MDLSAFQSEFSARFGEPPSLVSVAPGRVNLIGEHTDYNDGFVFPAAIDRVTHVAALPTDGPSQLFSLQAGEAEPFDAATIEPGVLTSWSKYAAGMAWALRQSGHAVQNLKVLVSSTVPMGSGVSSSAALEMAFGVIWNQLGSLGLKNQEIAHLGKTCENKFVGVNSGIMDQMASAMGRDNSAMFLDTRSLEITYAALSPEFSIVLCDTKKPRALSDSAYNERRSQCETAAAALGVPALRDATFAQLEAAKSGLDPVVYRRAKHVITENDRCREFVLALNAGDQEAIGALMRGSHESLRDDYEVSCPELDQMAEAAWNAPGVVGARMTGAGFGGACVALVRSAEVEAFIASVLPAYRLATGLDGEAMVCAAVNGAHIVQS